MVRVYRSGVKVRSMWVRPGCPAVNWHVSEDAGHWPDWERPPQVPNVLCAAGVAVSVTSVPVANGATHVPATLCPLSVQLIPAGADVTTPLPPLDIELIL